jgi:hypothetical protein
MEIVSKLRRNDLWSPMSASSPAPVAVLLILSASSCAPVAVFISWRPESMRFNGLTNREPTLVTLDHPPIASPAKGRRWFPIAVAGELLPFRYGVIARFTRNHMIVVSATGRLLRFGRRRREECQQSNNRGARGCGQASLCHRNVCHSDYSQQFRFMISLPSCRELP